MKHDVTFRIPARELGKADIEFWVKLDGETLGKLEVSKGSLVWYPKDMSYGHKLSWSEFDSLARPFPRSEKRQES